MFVTNGDNEIAEMHVTINGEKFEQEFTPGKATVKWMYLPKPNKSGGYRFSDYKYFDENGNLVKEFE